MDQWGLGLLCEEFAKRGCHVYPHPFFPYPISMTDFLYWGFSSACWILRIGVVGSVAALREAFVKKVRLGSALVTKT